MNKNKYLLGKQNLKSRSTKGLDFIKLDKSEVEDSIKEMSEELASLQELIFAENKHRVLIVLQGLDTSGKDGTVKHVFSATNPQGVKVASFKEPNDIEKSHDFLWRIHKEVPRNGEITIFNRSHYEDFIVPYVHKLLPNKRLKDRIEEINHFEKFLINEGVTIIKFFLHVSKKEQAQRIQERIDSPKKHWKFSLSDLHERQFWNRYQEAYDMALKATHHPDRPWYVIPADHKRIRDCIVSKILVSHLRALKADLPGIDPKVLKKIQKEATQLLKK